MPVWQRISDAGAGFIYHFSQSIALAEWRCPGFLEPASDGTMIIVSDYSGQHKKAKHEAYSFLVTTDTAISQWIPAREAFREQWLKDGRRISFKQLRDAARWNALVPFLKTASTIKGNLITVLVDRRITSFMAGGPEAIIGAFPDILSAEIKPHTAEKMFRVSSFIGMLIAGLRQQSQESVWFSDHDEVLETHGRREEFGKLASLMSFAFTRWKNPADVIFGTTESPNLPDWVEDAASIPDLVAGSSCQLSHIIPAYFGKETWGKIVNHPTNEDKRSLLIWNWMAAAQGSLRHILLRLEMDEEGQPRTSAQFFVGTVPRQGLIIPPR